MDKLVIPNIDSYMSIARPSCRNLKEDQIPFFQFTHSNPFSDSELFPGRPRELNIKDLIDLLHKGGTIDPLEG